MIDAEKRAYSIQSIKEGFGFIDLRETLKGLRTL
jgi:hypothetical protein